MMIGENLRKIDLKIAFNYLYAKNKEIYPASVSKHS